MICPHSLDRPKVEFSGLCHDGGLATPSGSCNAIGRLLPIGPALWSTGIVYLAYPLWSHWAVGTIGLPAVAFIHTAAAYLMMIFVIIHVYMTTTGKRRPATSRP